MVRILFPGKEESKHRTRPKIEFAQRNQSSKIIATRFKRRRLFRARVREQTFTCRRIQI